MVFGFEWMQCDVLDMDMDLAQLEWLSGLLDDASIPTEPAFAACAQPIIRASALSANAGVVLPDHTEEDALFRSSSPTSVLEDSAGGFNANKNGNGGGGGSSASSSSSSASSSSESFSGAARPWSVPVSPRPDPPVFVVPARARSKRSRASAFPTAIRAAAPPPEATILVPTPMYWPTTSSYSEPESIAESNSSLPPAMKKKKKAKRPAPPVTSDAEGDGDADYEEGSGGGGAALPPGAVRRCTHCQIEKTPQWRAGPLGPKTLCNACGVRYKSGRLFPEYRPAASPTFVPAVHSNSHKKVVEMRQKVEPKGDDLLQFIRRRD
jgi:GATA-binding protein 2